MCTNVYFKATILTNLESRDTLNKHCHHTIINTTSVHTCRKGKNQGLTKMVLEKNRKYRFLPQRTIIAILSSTIKEFTSRVICLGSNKAPPHTHTYTLNTGKNIYPQLS